MDPANRLTRIMRRLERERQRHTSGRGDPSAPSVDAPISGRILRQQWAEEYPGTDNGDALWERDLRALRERGLIQTGLVVEDSDRSPDGLRLRWIPKSKDLALTEDEHRVLSAARSALALGSSSASTSPTRHRQRSDFDIITSLVRHLEENDEPALASSLALALGVPAGRLRKLLRGFDDITATTESGFVGLDVVPVGPDPGPDSDLSVTLHRPLAASAMGSRSRAYGRGLAEIGRFAYTAEETADRLSVIERTLRDRTETHPDLGLLLSAKNKLEAWGRHLEEESGAM